MFFRKPKLSREISSSSFELLQDALSQYSVNIAQDDGGRELKSLNMDDIDFLEAIQLVEGAISVKIDKKSLRPSTVIDDVVTLIDQARKRPTGSAR